MYKRSLNFWRKRRLILIVILSVSISVFLLNGLLVSKQENVKTKTSSQINVVLIVCGDNVNMLKLVRNFLKTCFLFTTEKTVKFTIFTQEAIRKHINEMLKSWPAHIRGRHVVEFRKASYPKAFRHWMNFFVPCASLRLFLPDILTEMDAAIFLDVDFLVMTSLSDVWKEFDRFSPKQMIGIGHEREIWSNESWYNDKNRVKFPFIAPYGANAGILLMNFTRMRQFEFFKKINFLFDKYKSLLSLHDQDLINILGFFYPEIIYKLDCSLNFLPYHCVPELNCKSARNEGPKLLHGTYGRFIGNKGEVLREPSFELLFNTLDKYNFTNSLKHLISEYQKSGKTLRIEKCSKYADLIIKPLISLKIE